MEYSESAWRSSVFPVAKPDIMKQGKIVMQYRIVTPFFNINPLLNVRAVPLPQIDDLRAELANSTWFSTLDLRDAFFQIPLEKDSRKYTAFACTGSALYQYCVLPMGCTISGALLQSAMTQIVGDLLFNGGIIYMDDIIIYTKGNREHHLKFFKTVVNLLEKADARVKLCKIKVGWQKVEFLGFKVGIDGWEIHSKYIDSVRSAKKPETLTQLRSFLGLINWQRNFISNFTEKANLLLELLKKEKNVKQD